MPSTRARPHRRRPDATARRAAQQKGAASRRGRVAAEARWRAAALAGIARLEALTGEAAEVAAAGDPGPLLALAKEIAACRAVLAALATRALPDRPAPGRGHAAPPD